MCNLFTHKTNKFIGFGSVAFKYNNGTPSCPRVCEMMGIRNDTPAFTLPAAAPFKK